MTACGIVALRLKTLAPRKKAASTQDVLTVPRSRGLPQTAALTAAAEGVREARDSCPQRPGI